MPHPYGPVGALALANKIVLITGGGSGIGLAFAKLCLEASARVVIGDLDLTDEAREVFGNAESSQVINRRCDVTSWKDLHDLVSASVESFGDVPDVYAPVAGIFEPVWSNFWDDTEDDEGNYRTMRVNVDHPIKLTRLAMRALAGAEKKGVVCLVASTAAINALYLANLYCASKHAIVGFARSMAQADRDEGVKVVCVLPGLVDSPLWRVRDDGIMDWMRFGEGKAISTEDVAEVMIRMVVEEGYSGGTCVVKRADEERVMVYDWDKQERSHQSSPRPPEADLVRIRRALDKERGRKWVAR